jgi:hypothetical protein
MQDRKYMSKRKFAFVLLALFFSIVSLAQAKLLTFKCDTETYDHQKVSFSLILDEKKSKASLNAVNYSNVNFEEYRVTGIVRKAFSGMKDIAIETKFDLDRITGTFILQDMLVTENGDPLSEDQLMKTLDRKLLALIGECKKTDRLF